MKDVTGLVRELRSLGYSLRGIADELQVDYGYMSRVASGKIVPRDSRVADLLELRRRGYQRAGSRVSVVHYCTPGKQPIDDGLRLRTAAAIFSALRGFFLSENAGQELIADLPSGVDGALALIGGPQGWPIIAIRESLTESERRQVVLHELNEHRQLIKRAICKALPPAPRAAF